MVLNLLHNFCNETLSEGILSGGVADMSLLVKSQAYVATFNNDPQFLIRPRKNKSTLRKNDMTFSNPQYLLETDWLEMHLADSDVRVLDCTVFFHTDDRSIRRESGRNAWIKGHIPGRGFADLIGDLSDRDSHLPLMMPPVAQFAEAMSRYGVGEGTRVILYDDGMNIPAARVW